MYLYVNHGLFSVNTHLTSTINICVSKTHVKIRTREASDPSQ